MFVDYALGLLDDVNTLFQSQVPIFYGLKIEVVQLVETLLKNFKNGHTVRSFTDIVKIDVEGLQKVCFGLDAKAAMADPLVSSDGRITHPNEEKFCRSSVTHIHDSSSDNVNK